MKPSEKWIYIDKHINSFNLFRDIKILFSNLFLIQALLRRDFLSVFKQTILGPTWFILQPVVTTIVFTIIFGRVAQIPTDGISPFLFYLSGVVGWNFFIQNTGRSSNLLGDNFSLLSKIVFPIIILPFNSIVITMLRFLIQYISFLLFLIFFWFIGFDFKYSFFSILTTFYSILNLAILSSGLGMLMCSLTTKYKDMVYVNSFVLGLMIYVTPVVYPLSSATGKLGILLSMNPITFHVELFRYSHLGEGTLIFYSAVWSMISSIIIFYIGYLMFKRRATIFVDTI